MGDFRITVNAVGGHGCQREVKDGGRVYGCGSMNCPDCITAKYINELRQTGTNVKDAKIEHWPGQPHTVVDDFLMELDRTGRAQRVRRGSF